jgi:hypothetical protein
MHTESDRLTDAEREHRDLYGRPPPQERKPARRVEFLVDAKALVDFREPCRACKAPIALVVHTGTGRRMPVDVATAVSAGPEHPGKVRVESHFAHCPEAGRFRRRAR